MSHRNQLTREKIVPFKDLRAVSFPDGDIKIQGPNGGQADLTHHAFNQLANIASLSAATLRSAIENFIRPDEAAKWVADGINLGLEGRFSEFNAAQQAKIAEKLRERAQGKHVRICSKSIDANILFQLPNGNPLTARSFNTEKYSRIWDLDICKKLLLPLWEAGFTNPPAMDGPAGLYASDRDFFAFACPKDVSRINMPGLSNRSLDNSLSGFEIGGQNFFPFIICSNSEVGGSSAEFFGGLLQHVCGNHILWNVRDAVKFSIRHTGLAFQRLEDGFLDFLRQWTSAGTMAERQALQASLEFYVAKDRKGTVEWLNDRGWAKKTAENAVERIENGDKSTGIHDQNPTRLFNIVAALTAQAREIPHQDSRITVEQKAGKLLSLAAARN